MIRRINRLVAALLIVSVSIYFVTRNRDDITVSISPNNTISASVGVIVLAAFAFGIIAATLAGALMAFQSYMRERKLLAVEKQRLAFERIIMKARALSASGELQRAREQWEHILKRDPSHTIARIELSRILERDGRIQEALKVIDAARAAVPENVEVLFRAAELQNTLGNKTAAIDNLALILYSEPNARAARLARDLSVELERIGDAIEYNTRLESIEGLTDEVQRSYGDLYTKRILADHTGDSEALKTALFTHLRKYPASSEALERIADIHLFEGMPDDAAQYLVRAYKISQNRSLMLRARTIWIEAGLPDKAISLMKSWTRDAAPVDAAGAHIELAKTYLLAARDPEAAETLQRLEQDSKIFLTEQSRKEIAILKALIAYRSRDSLESASAWREVELLELGTSRRHVSLNPR